MPTRTKAAATRAPSARKASKTAPVAAPKRPARAAARSGASKTQAGSDGASRKRKADDDTPVQRAAEVDAPQVKKSKILAVVSGSQAAKGLSVEVGKKINDAPSRVLDVYVFGEGTSGELGLGSRRVNGKKPIDVKRPRLNDNLSAKSVGVVQVACGGMHVIALTRDNRILTWGVNDQGALGRDTTWDGNLIDADADASDSDDDDDTSMNPLESVPMDVSADHFAPGTKFVQVVASDSASFTLTQDGRVYGWGTFRSSDGILGFAEGIMVQMTPVFLPSLKNIKYLAAGSNHILALDHKGSVVAWGCGQQNQLGRRIIERNKLSSLIPQGIGLPRGKISKIACGSYHSFALDHDGQVWGWGLNNFGEISSQGDVGEKDAVILKPVKLTGLQDFVITEIDGGVHHSLACSDKGDLITWGRVDGFQCGFEPHSLDKDDIIFDERANPRILIKPTKHHGLPGVVSVAAGSDNSFAVTHDGKVYSWGFSANYQTGQGTIEDVHTPTLVDNTATRDKKIIRAYAGGQFSMFVGEADAFKANGVHGP